MDSGTGMTRREPHPTASSTEERDAYLALALVPRLGARRLAELLSAFGSASDVIGAPRESYKSKAYSQALLLAKHADPVQAVLTEKRLAEQGITIVVPPDPLFPARLRSIPDPPVLLYLKGRLDVLSLPSVAIVGSREHSAYGGEMARMLAGSIAEAGVVVVSGMARGLDAVAHEAALDAGGTTIGVLGSGIDVQYPKSNEGLYPRVERDGLLLTENPPGEYPQRGAFPKRNRLISGLADVLVVIEGAKGSGTMITVASALEQGREVMAVPGPITSHTSAGTNQLLKDGAEPILCVEDLLAKFGVKGKAAERSAEVGPLDPVPCNLSASEAQVLGVLSAEGRHLDDVAMATGLPIGVLLGVLCGLELGGLVEQLAGSHFRRVARKW